ncbi:hypothetical protein [Tumebacillus flagellatus]|uniref:hypothetical protein n=1 Tax=Tumebacillus flagellatus TaxID=1157490 RepID=UPI001376B431|nr:hypothetical protein [Tumebacillus flagellatus]
MQKKNMDVHGNFIPPVITGRLAQEILNELARPAGTRQLTALKKALKNRVGKKAPKA